MNFFRNITSLGFRYFRLKTKPNQFSQRALMRALGYSESGASYITWRDDKVVPSGERLQKLCDQISALILEKEQVIVKISSKDLFEDSIEEIINSAKRNTLANLSSLIQTEDLNQQEKTIIALLRLLKNHDDYSDYVVMLETLIKLISRQIDDDIPDKLRYKTEFETVKNMLLEWIEPKIMN